MSTTIFQSFSSLAWLAVIALQAFFHFVVGPRYKTIDTGKADTLDCGDSNISKDEQQENTVNDECTTDTHFELERKSDEQQSNIDDQEVVKPSSMTVSLCSSCATLAVSEDSVFDPDECDSISDIQHSNTIQHFNKEEDAVTSSHVKPRTKQNVQRDNEKSTKENADKEDSKKDNNTCSYYYEEEKTLSQHFQENNDDCIEEDEEWRYQLIKDYYSNPYHDNMMKSSSISNLDVCLNEQEDGPSLEVSTLSTLVSDANDDTIHSTSGERLQQQRMLAKLKLKTQQNNTNNNVTFDRNPVSVIASF